MKILVAIDLTLLAENAAMYAVQLAKNFKDVEITFYNAYAKRAFDEGEGSVKYLRIEEMRELAEKIKVPKKANIIYIAEGGVFITVLEKYITENKIDLVVVGNNEDHSKKGLSEINISGMIRNINIPVLIVPLVQNLNKSNFKDLFNKK